MREIKFRAWDKENESMMYDFHDGELPSHGVNKTIANVQKVFPVMQFTGLHDKNDKEIYEGDILSYGVWSDGRGLCLHKVIWNEEEAAFNTIENRQPYQVFSHVDTFNAEVIGNIYETPELLETK